MFTHFYSDPHFGHANIIRYAERPFRTVEEMDEELVSRYNARVSDQDHVLWLGDCVMNPAHLDTVKRLNGRKTLVKGNHDPSNKRLREVGFESITKELPLTIAGVPCRACHYPYYGRVSKVVGERWPKPVEGEVLLHGHTHVGMRIRGRMIHCGVDAWHYRPVELAEVEALIKTMECLG